MVMKQSDFWDIDPKGNSTLKPYIGLCDAKVKMILNGLSSVFPLFQINCHISVNGDVIFIIDWHRH